MLSIVLKNFVLFFLIVIIFHFLIINELISSRNTLGANFDSKTKLHSNAKKSNKKRNSIDSYNLEEVQNKYIEVKNTHQKTSSEDPKTITTDTLGVTNDTIQVEPPTPTNSLIHDKEDTENKSRCHEMTRTSKVVANDSKMKELYDFVFDETDSKDKLSKSFEVDKSRVQSTPITDKEIVKHHDEIKKSLNTENQQQMFFDYEIIGNVDIAAEDGLMGIDSMSSGSFSKII